jgi:hypothetical protein
MRIWQKNNCWVTEKNLTNQNVKAKKTCLIKWSMYVMLMYKSCLLKETK